MSIGKFGTIAIRGGKQQDTTHELILKSLNQARGSAYNTQEGSLVWCENYALAKALCIPWNASERFRNSFDPNTMTEDALSRWEGILNLYPSTLDTITDRKKRVAVIWKIWTEPSTINNIRDIVKALIPSIFVEVELRTPYAAGATFPYTPLSFTTAGGTIAIPQGDYWTSEVANFRVRVWQPRDKLGNKVMSDSDFNNISRWFESFLVNYIPAYTTFDVIRFRNPLPGTITMTVGSATVVGTATTFTTSLEVGMRFEVVDDAGNLQTFTVASITSNTSMTTTSTSPSAITNRVYYCGGFFLDVPSNLDNDLLF